MKKLLDLRFVIGLFFLVVGVLLVGYHFIFSNATETINVWCGILFIAFAVMMLTLSKQEQHKNPQEN
ncbi:MAG TPA: hypothetical protein VFW07_16360 [Parafilimonas sp.]|nr:hypothetical protein [Parafilimonas sp.]